MAESKARVMLLLMATLAITVPCLVNANIGEFDDYLLEKAKEARRMALQAYEPDPLNVTHELNMHIHLAMNEANIIINNHTRGRDLGERKKRGPCMATNPIDRCWRCDRNWEMNRFKLATCAKGFGHKTTGGLGGKIYVVTDPSDADVVNPKPGTLRYGAIQKEPLWIIFARSMVIKLQQELMINSDKTIDGRGANIQIKSGGGLTLQFVKNVIIHNLRIRNIKAKKGGMIRDAPNHIGLRTRSDGDAISIFGSTNVWIDHISMSNADDGLIDAIMGSTAITISNCHMTRHNDVMLFGAGDVYVQDKLMQITVAFNHFGNGLIQRMPRCRHGWFHVVNNDYHNWIMYAIGGTANPTILSQGNRFSGPNNVAAKQNLIQPRPGNEAPLLSRYSGQLNCRAGKPC
ncbi:hypothetical protein K1719_008125 [Acacia pycnantha]|nr:hypothetical protein K1719_008125 [Acacia pycnantha]